MVSALATTATSRLLRPLAAAIALVALVLVACSWGPARANEPQQDELWAALRAGGHVALMRHALAPGTSDPPDFRVEDCATQRNLSAEGRAQAVRIGDLFRAQGLRDLRVLSSQWCRCLDTASLLALGPVEELPALNSFFRDRQHSAAQTAALQDWLAAQPHDQVLLLVTHQVNITALTGAFTRSGEIVVARRNADGGLSPLGSIPTQ